MFDSPLSAMFSSVGIFYGLLLPLIISLSFVLLLVAGLQYPGAKARNTAQAIYCYLFMGVGILMMTIAAIPTATSVLAGLTYPSITYVGLIILFAAGGWLFLTHEQWLLKVDTPSKTIPSLVFVYLFKILGMLAIFFSGTSIILTLLLGDVSAIGWWVMPCTMFFYGLVISWCSWSVSPHHNIFRSIPLIPPSSSFSKVRIATAPAAAPAKKKSATKKAAPAKKTPKKKASAKKK